MSIILGFGQPDMDAANRQKADLSNFLKNKLEETDIKNINHEWLVKVCNEFSSSRPKFQGKNKEWNHCFIGFPRLGKQYDSLIGIIHGDYSAYNNNHPFSPDGFAAWTIPFSLSFVRHKNKEDYDKLVEMYDY